MLGQFETSPQRTYQRITRWGLPFKTNPYRRFPCRGPRTPLILPSQTRITQAGVTHADEPLLGSKRFQKLDNKYNGETVMYKFTAYKILIISCCRGLKEQRRHSWHMGHPPWFFNLLLNGDCPLDFQNSTSLLKRTAPLIFTLQM